VIVLAADVGATTGLALLELQDGRPTWLDGMSTRGLFVDGPRLIATPRECFADLGNVDCVVVEVPGNIQSGGKSTGAGLSIGKHLIASAEQAGLLLGWAQAHRVPTLRATAHVWRKAVVGKGNATDAEVKVAVTRQVAGLPERTNAHVRDAVGLGVWGLAMMRERAVAA
jgi:hypothetical protein